MTILHLFSSPGHNFYGNHGKPAGSHPVTSHKEIQLVAGRGIEGDRFFDWKEDYKGQITFIDHALIQRVREFAETPELPAAAFRRNVVTDGLDLNALVGQRFRMQGLLFEGVEECRPCYWMDKACGKSGTEDLMKGHGGLRCRILESGPLTVGDAPVSPVPHS